MSAEDAALAFTQSSYSPPASRGHTISIGPDTSGSSQHKASVHRRTLAINEQREQGHMAKAQLDCRCSISDPTTPSADA